MPLSREFLLSRGVCCHNGCLNCPYKEDEEESSVEDKSVKKKPGLFNPGNN
jgi:hypothetical protein